LVRYDFSSGDSLAAKNGWAFADANWRMTPSGDGAGMGLAFLYGGGLPGTDRTSELRFTMPPQDQFWMRFRWHIPANYAHRHDTRLAIANAPAAGWQLGDRVRGTNGVSKGVISRVDDTAVFLRFATDSWLNNVWTGTVTNVTRNSALTSTQRAQWPANNKLLALWTDGYSAQGLGPTIIWTTELAWPGIQARDTYLAMAHSKGGNTGTGPGASGGVLITPADRGTAIDLIVQARFSTSPGAKDGVIRTFVRKQGETAYVMRHNITNADLDKRSDVAPHLAQWRAGYLMGWANSGYDATTTFHITKLEVFSQQPAELNGVAP
jgi:hypothetical protein